MSENIYQVGQKVVTRRGKTGVVVETFADGGIMVRFGSYDPIKLRQTQVVTEGAWQSMQAAGRTMASNQRYNGRVS